MCTIRKCDSYKKQFLQDSINYEEEGCSITEPSGNINIKCWDLLIPELVSF